MRFLADENFPKPLTDKIRKFGFSVKTIQQKQLRGSSDQTILRIAQKEKRIILTFDKDFLRSRQIIQAIIFDFPQTPTSEILQLVDDFLQKVAKVRRKNKIIKFSKKGLAILR